MRESTMVSTKRVREIIETIIYLNIATVDRSAQPWNTAVFSAYDEDFNFYWGSHVDSQHSHNIKDNPKVFITIYDSTVPAGEGEGVYIQAVANEVKDSEEIKKAHTLLQNRRPVPYWRLDQMRGDGPVRVYKAVPQKVWMNGEAEKDGDYIDTRIEVNID